MVGILDLARVGVQWVEEQRQVVQQTRKRLWTSSEGEGTGVGVGAGAGAGAGAGVVLETQEMSEGVGGEDGSRSGVQCGRVPGSTLLQVNGKEVEPVVEPESGCTLGLPLDMLQLEDWHGILNLSTWNSLSIRERKKLLVGGVRILCFVCVVFGVRGRRPCPDTPGGWCMCVGVAQRFLDVEAMRNSFPEDREGAQTEELGMEIVQWLFSSGGHTCRGGHPVYRVRKVVVGEDLFPPTCFGDRGWTVHSRVPLDGL